MTKVLDSDLMGCDAEETYEVYESPNISEKLSVSILRVDVNLNYSNMFLSGPHTNNVRMNLPTQFRYKGIGSAVCLSESQKE